MVQVEIKKIRPIKAACIECKGPYNEMGPHFRELYGWARENNVRLTEVPGIALECDDPAEVGPENCRYRVCVPVKGTPKGSGHVKIETLPEVEVACTLHKGSYVGLPEKWQEMMQWIGQNHYTVAEIPREVYLNDCWETPESELLTEIQVPIKK